MGFGEGVVGPGDDGLGVGTLGVAGDGDGHRHLRIGEGRHGSAQHVGEGLGPARRACGAPEEHQRGAGLAREALDLGQEPGQVVGGALDHRPDEVLAGRLQRDVQEAAPGLTVTGRGHRADHPGQEEDAPRPRLGRRQCGLQMGEGAVQQGHAVLNGLARDPVLGRRQVVVGSGTGHRHQLGLQVPPLVGHRVENDGGRPHGDPDPAVGQHAGGQPAGRTVVEPGPDPDPPGQAQLVGDGVAQRADDGVDRHQLGQARPVDPAEGQELVVVVGHPERPVVVELGGEHRVLGRRRPARETGHDVVHGLQVVGGDGVDIRSLPLEVEEVAQRQAAADRRDPVDLHEALEGVGVLAHEGPAEVAPPLVVVHRHGRHRHQVGADRHDRGVLAAHRERPDRRVRDLTDGVDHRRPGGLGILFDHIAVAAGRQRAFGRGLQHPRLVDPSHLHVRAADIDADGGDAHVGGSACWSSIISVITARMNSSASGVMPPGMPP